MQKSLVQSGKLSLGDTVSSGLLSLIVVAVLGLGFLIAEGALLEAQGIHGIVYPLIAVFAASIISSIAGKTGPLSDACAGFLGGITGGLAGFPGASVTIWCGLKGWDKARQRGVFQPFILVMQLVALLAIHLMQPSSTKVQLDWKVLTFVPAALLGAWFGLRIFKWLSDRQFEHVVNALLILSGIGLIL